MLTPKWRFYFFRVVPDVLIPLVPIGSLRRRSERMRRFPHSSSLAEDARAAQMTVLDLNWVSAGRGVMDYHIFPKQIRILNVARSVHSYAPIFFMSRVRA
jgi:hypothetical protein